jgi:5,10-methylenetetrahydrofolate reductase
VKIKELFTLKKMTPSFEVFPPGKEGEPEEMEKYGIEYAIRQAEDLIRNEVSGLHLYSMNRSEPMRQILRELSLGK